MRTNPEQLKARQSEDVARLLAEAAEQIESVEGMMRRAWHAGFMAAVEAVRKERNG